MQKKNDCSGFLLKCISTLLPCLFIALPFCSFSQAKLGTFSVNLPSTAYMKTTVAVTVTVTNTGSAAFNGPIDVYYATDSAYVPVLLGIIPSALLAPGASAVLNTNLLIDTLHFEVGSNIVVVWGSGSGITTSEQSWKIIQVDTLAGAGVSSLYFDGSISIYPNPAFNFLFVEYKSTKNYIEEVRIFDLLGSIISSGVPSFISANDKINVDVSAFPAGLYFVEIVNSAGQRCRMKFVK